MNGQGKRGVTVRHCSTEANEEVFGWGTGGRRMKEAKTKRGMSGKGYPGADAHGWHTKALTCTLPLHVHPACRMTACSRLCVWPSSPAPCVR